MAFKERRPRIARRIDTAQHDEGQLAVEIAVLLGHEVAYHALAYGFHLVGHAELRLQLLLAGMPDGGLGGCTHGGPLEKKLQTRGAG
jgi:hypothetical protein